MRKWQYLYIRAYKNDVEEMYWAEGNRLKYQSVSGKNNLPVYMNQLGEQYWEMVGVSTDSETGAYKMFVFKRLAG